MQLPIKANSTNINHLLPGHYLTPTDENTYTSETNFSCTYLLIVKIKQILSILGQPTKKKKKKSR